ncbi:MAG: phosphoribosylamine--glycine ligase [Planctomycetes bacterium]|nr:phosphoribosylamine--glycine ligase [Planctomycetota bacterium]NOG54064.1 phosphoribosylamine--glycine ligase [Planctomycetota bacterium]
MTNPTTPSQSPRRAPDRCPQAVNVLLIGGGGREHALAWKLSQSPRLGTLWATHCTNPGIAALARHCDQELDPRATWHLENWCEQNDIHLVVVGPEAPLAEGIADRLSVEGKRYVVGPTKAGARIEWDKAWAKQLMRSAAVPTAEARAFQRHEQALEYVSTREFPPVIKASGLAAGKGVIVPETMEQAIEALDRIMVQNEFGKAGQTVLVEERLHGPEVSIMALVDGKTIYILDSAQDHKRLGEGDAGPNTGGMGAYSPASGVLDDETLGIIQQTILVPVLDALRREEIDYRGVLYAGLMLTHAGPKVLEFNCRFGDPECQPLMARMKADLVEVLWATATGHLEDVQIDWDERCACCVVLASDGYPGKYETGREISGLDELSGQDDVFAFHAGTACDAKSGQIVTAGGRVLGITALADSLEQARQRANEVCERVSFKGAYHRRDIGSSALAGHCTTGE